MSIGKLEKLFQEILETQHENLNADISKKDMDYSKIVIPFSKVFKTYKPRDVYLGNEKIPFIERDPEYRMILRQEFKKLKKKKLVILNIMSISLS